MCAKTWAVVLLVLFLSENATGQQYAFRICFTDKEGSPDISNPSMFLSPRSLERRKAQGIALDSTDRPVSPVYIHKVLELTDGAFHVASKWLNSCVIRVSDSSNIIALEGEPFISSITYVGYYGDEPIDRKGPVKKELRGAEWKTTADSASYGATWTQTHLVHGECLHDNGWQGQGKLIAVLDDGFHYVDSAPAFDSLYSSGRIIDTKNFVLPANDVYTDFWQHGTEVLSTIAGYLPNIYVGAAPLAQYVLYVTEDQTSETPVEMDNMVAGFERADSIGADIVSSSLGYNTFDVPFPSIPSSELDGKTTVAAIGANIAVQKGMLLVITAGNEGSGGLLTPGDADSVITVGSVNSSGQPAGNTGNGPNASGIVKPDVCAMGNPGYVLTNTTTPFAVSGTSIATPQIAGMAACLWQGSAGKSNFEIKQAILKTASLYTTPQLPKLGYGIPDFCQANVMLDVPEVAHGLSSVNVYPNPSDGKFLISYSASRKTSARFTVTDITGKVILQEVRLVNEGQNQATIALPNAVSAGVYICSMQIDGQRKVIKLLKK
ncbi:MAG TPA: S8/S53 family peptidase [Flavipsychrobacter sp.]|nr:S8/S53 family peptidase [Flavipsychrobacter sp.]